LGFGLQALDTSGLNDLVTQSNRETMNHQLFILIHVTSVILLSGVTFAAFAAPSQDNRRPALMMSGVLTLMVFLTGFGAMGMMGLGFPGWAMVKVVCWLVLSGLTGMAFRMTGQIPMLRAVAAVVILIAVAMVIYKPF
jgi:hypothetical protein